MKNWGGCSVIRSRGFMFRRSSVKRTGKHDMNLSWIVIGIVGSFVVFHFIRGFISGLGITGRPKFKVVRYEETE